MDRSQFSLRELLRVPKLGDNNLGDKIFSALFYSCIGFFSTFIGMFGRVAFQVPFILMSILVCLRFAMRPACRQEMLQQLRSKQCLLILLFAAVVLLYVVAGVYVDSDRTRLFGKPAIILLAVMLFAFVWAYRSSFDKPHIVNGIFYGILGGLVGVTFVSLWNWTAVTTSTPDQALAAIPISIYALNDEMKVLSVLVFIAAAGLTNRRSITIAALGLSAYILVLSFWTHGLHYYPDGNSVIVHTGSDVVQFGVPIVMALFLVSLWAPAIMTNVIFTGIATLLICTPWMFQFWYRFAEELALPRATKFLVRAEIWDKMAQISLSRPFLGHGLDATRYMENIDFAQKYFKTNEATHPHNMFVQIWLDMGLLGVFFALSFCYFSWNAVQRIHDSVKPAVVAGITMYVFIALSTHSLWKTASIILLCLMCVQVIVLTTRETVPKA